MEHFQNKTWWDLMFPLNGHLDEIAKLLAVFVKFYTSFYVVQKV